eukprot:6186112-Pleurochrysis_carterae.AAC.8
MSKISRMQHMLGYTPELISSQGRQPAAPSSALTCWPTGASCLASSPSPPPLAPSAAAATRVHRIEARGKEKSGPSVSRMSSPPSSRTAGVCAAPFPPLPPFHSNQHAFFAEARQSLVANFS